MILPRRSFLTGIGATLITAPAIVRAGSLMPVKQMLIGDGIALSTAEHPWRIGVVPPNDFTEQAFVELLLNMKRDNGALVMRPRFLHTP